MVHVRTGFNRTNVRRSVESAVRDTLSFFNQSFGAPHHRSDLPSRARRARRRVGGGQLARWREAGPEHEVLLDQGGFDFRRVENWVPDVNSRDSLLIPRIDPENPMDDNDFPKDFPDHNRPEDPNAILIEDEMPQDGLWIKAKAA